MSLPRSSAGVRRALALTSPFLLIAALYGCTTATYFEPDIPARTVEASFEIEIDPEHPSLDTPMRVPLEEPVRVVSSDTELAATVHVKRTPNREGILWVEIFVENTMDDAIRDVTFTLLGIDRPLYDLREDPYSEATSQRTFLLGGIASRGVGRIHLGLDEAGGPLSFSLSVHGTTTDRRAANSAPLVVTPDGREVWVPVPDADTVTILDADSHARIAEIYVPGHPMGITTSSDGRFILVTSAHANTVSVIDRTTRDIVQVFTEADGIGREPRNIVVTPDGSRALVSAYVGDSLTVLVRRGDRYTVGGVVSTGRRPSGVSVDPTSTHAFVSHFLPRGRAWENASWVSVIDLNTLQVVREPEFADVLNLDTAHCLADVFGASSQRFTADAARHSLAGVFLDPSGNHGWIPHGATGPAPVFERGQSSVEISPAFFPRPGEAVSGLISILDTHAPAAATPLSNPGNLERPVDPSYLACANFSLEIEGSINDPIPGYDAQTSDHFAANPVGYTALDSAGIQRSVAFTLGGRRALAISHITDTLMVVDAMTFHPTARRNLTLSGANPTGIAITPDGRKAFVSYENSLFVSVLDLTEFADRSALPGPSFVPYEYREVPELVGGQNGIGTERLVRHVETVPEQPPIAEVAQVSLIDEDPLDPQMRRGRILFSSSNVQKYPELTAVTMTACASCHLGGGTDGSMWATMEGERKTMGLWGGTRDRGWLHISATHRDIESFAETVVIERLGGELDRDDRAAIVRYVADGIPRLQHPVVDESLAAEGRALFEEHCSSCHQGARMTSGMPDPDDPLGGGMASGPILFDVGTAVEDAHIALAPFIETLLPEQDAEILRLCRGDRDLGEGDHLQELLDFRQRPTRARGQFKAPDLTNVWEHTLFLHDGRYDRLQDVVHFFVEELSLPVDTHGEAAITEYLRTL